MHWEGKDHLLSLPSVKPKKTILGDSWVLLEPWNPQKVPSGWSQHGRVNMLLRTLLTLSCKSTLVCFVMLELKPCRPHCSFASWLQATFCEQEVIKAACKVGGGEGTYSPLPRWTVFLQNSGTSAPTGRCLLEVLSQFCRTAPLNNYILMSPITSLCSLSPRPHGSCFLHLIPTWYLRVVVLPFSYLVNNFIPN